MREIQLSLDRQTVIFYIVSRKSLVCWSQLNPEKMGTVAFDGNVISLKTAALQKAARLENLKIFENNCFFHFLPALSCTGTFPLLQIFLELNN